MNQKFTLRPAGKFQGMEQSTANLNTSISYNLFSKLKWISFVMILGVSQMLLSQTIFNQPIQLPGTPFGPSLSEVLTIDPPGNVFRSPYFPIPPGGAENGTLLWNGTNAWNYNTEFQRLPGPNPVIASPINAFPTYYFSQTSATTPNLSVLADGNIGTNHSLTPFGTFGSGAKWNALGVRPASGIPYIESSGLRCTWDDFGFNVALTESFSSTVKDALISWQDATVTGPTNANNRLVFGVRDGTTTSFQELGQFASNGSFGIGLANALIPLTEKLELYGLSSFTPLYQRWRKDPSSAGSRIGLNGTNDNFEIRNDVLNTPFNIPNIEFWTNNNPQVYINEQTGGTPFLGVGTAGPATPTVNLQGPGGAGGWITGVFPNPPIPLANPYLSVLNGDITTTGNFYGTNIFITSDERLKKNIVKLPEWKKIFDIESYTYQYVDQKHNLNSYGFLAQDVYKSIPELTSGWGDALSVNYIGFIPFLSQGLKEHEDRLVAIEEVIETEKQILEQVKLLDSENNELKNQNELLKERLEALERKLESICQLPCLQEGSVKSENTRINGGTLELMDNAILYQNEPNPFTSSTVIRYYLPEGTKNSKITVKNADGKIVGEYQNLINGNGSITIEPGNLAANTYYYSLIIDGIEVETKKMILIR
jgi:hypothetical protein